MRIVYRAAVVANLMLAATIAYTIGYAFAQPRGGVSIDAQVSLISVDEAARLLARARTPLLVDVREQPEFNVAHIVGALRLAPDADSDRVRTVSMLARRAKGRAVVFYCTTLGRSQRIAEALHLDLLEAGVARVLVVKGGVVAWSNEGLRLVNGRGRTTRLVHTHDAETAKSLAAPARARF